MKWKYWFVTKKDGTNWSSQTDMNNGNIEDMVLYESLDDIPEGHLCVGVYFESQGGYIYSRMIIILNMLKSKRYCTNRSNICYDSN